MFKKLSPYEKEWADMIKKEDKFLKARADKKDSIINRKLEKIVPAKLQDTIDEAFSKVFNLIFEKGTGFIEKTYSKERLMEKYSENDYASLSDHSGKRLRSFSKRAQASGTGNMLLSGAAGIGMGAAGVGIPDIPIFTAMLFKGIYEIALNYGYSYDNDRERNFILLIIQGAVSYGDNLSRINNEIDTFIRTGKFSSEINIEKQIKTTSALLSRELLYMKFLQGTPIVGAIGGVYDVIYMKNITDYANIKYKRRFLEKR
ncbi:MAG: EcsC family protein [Lachnospiraceae bacterium]|nr:EcsC family protein [Lachnospiraceae bacterium]